MQNKMRNEITVPNVDGLYLITNVFEQQQYNDINELLNQLTYSQVGNICRQVHVATEFGWTFLPLYGENGEIIKRTIDSYLGKFPELITNIWDVVSDKLSCINDLPSSLQNCIIHKIYPDHLLINQYQPEDGCIPHVDELEFWEDWVVGISFGSGCMFNFTLDKKKINVYVPENSVYVLTKDARYKWKHGIPFDHSDIIYGTSVNRKFRTSLTFRNIDKKWLSDDVRKSVN